MIRIEEELVVNNKTIDARILSRMFLAGAKNLEAKKSDTILKNAIKQTFDIC